MRVSRADALAALEAISEHLLPDVAETVVLHRYICPYVGLAQDLDAVDRGGYGRSGGNLGRESGGRDAGAGAPSDLWCS
jgi:hypothetical protein